MNDEMEIVEPDEVGEIEVWVPGSKTPVSLLRCPRCYLKDSCPLMDESTEECGLEALNTIDTNTSDGLINILQSVLAIQAKRVLRLSQWEDVEGGLPDPRVTEELLTLLTLIERFKRILSDEDSLVIRAKGKSASGVIAKLFGD